jgi:hypothetical protein
MAQIIPSTNLFIITSALDTGIGIIGAKDRLDQTIATLENLKQKVPNAAVLLVDGSPNKVSEETKQKISEYTQAIFWNDPDIFAMASSGRKSEAEIIMVFKTLLLFKQNPQMMKFFYSIKRIFKYSARSALNNDFDISKYDNLYGRYVFKTAIPSWMDENRKRNVTDHLYITRFYSLCPSLLDNYLQTLQPILNNVIQHGIDTEHSHYLCLDRRLVTEFDTLGVEGIMGGTGLKETY